MPIKIITNSGCPACDDLKERLKDRKDVEFLDIQTSDEAVDIALKNDIRSVPTAVEIDNKGTVKKCDIFFKGSEILFKCHPFKPTKQKP